MPNRVVVGCPARSANAAAGGHSSTPTTGGEGALGTGTGTVTWSNATYILPPMGGPFAHCVWEDPFVWLDKRGAWHLLSHMYPTNTTSWDQFASEDTPRGLSGQETRTMTVT